jgi:Asp-tRNA(Asn)/Glu-tRNA(Gln) amidotransferase B subunit
MSTPNDLHAAANKLLVLSDENVRLREENARLRGAQAEGKPMTSIQQIESLQAEIQRLRVETAVWNEAVDLAKKGGIR